MPRPAVADYVDSFFTRTLFQPDDELARSVLATELVSDANISINGKVLSSSEFVSLITAQFRSSFTASIIEIKDLNIVTANDTTFTGVVAQWTSYVTKGKQDGKEIKQSATTIVQVGERDGAKVVLGLWEAQTVDEA